MPQATSKNARVEDLFFFFFPLLSTSPRAFFPVLFFPKQLLVSLICAASSVNITHFRLHVRIGNSCCRSPQGAKLTVLFHLCCNLKSRAEELQRRRAALCAPSQSRRPNCEQLKSKTGQNKRGQVLHSPKWRAIPNTVMCLLWTNIRLCKALTHYIFLTTQNAFFSWRVFELDMSLQSYIINYLYSTYIKNFVPIISGKRALSV